MLVRFRVRSGLRQFPGVTGFLNGLKPGRAWYKTCEGEAFFMAVSLVIVNWAKRRANGMPSIEQKPECDLNVAEVGLDLPNYAAVHIVEGEIR